MSEQVGMGTLNLPYLFLKWVINLHPYGLTLPIWVNDQDFLTHNIKS